MDYQSLIDNWKKYDQTPKGDIKKDWDIKYKNSIESGIWSNSVSHIKEKFDFLNKFGCRVDRKTATSDIEEHSVSFNNLLQGTSTLNLLNINHKNLEEPKQIYCLLAKVNGLGPTGISKYLHMHKPDLFVMWDKQIFLDYFPPKTYSKATATSEKYVKFMLRMKREIQEALFTFPGSEYITETQAIIEFRNRFNNESLPRILDKYNYATRNKRKEEIR